MRSQAESLDLERVTAAAEVTMECWVAAGAELDLHTPKSWSTHASCCEDANVYSLRTRISWAQSIFAYEAPLRTQEPSRKCQAQPSDTLLAFPQRICKVILLPTNPQLFWFPWRSQCLRSNIARLDIQSIISWQVLSFLSNKRIRDSTIRETTHLLWTDKSCRLHVQAASASSLFYGSPSTSTSCLLDYFCVRNSRARKSLLFVCELTFKYRRLEPTTSVSLEKFQLDFSFAVRAKLKRGILFIFSFAFLNSNALESHLHTMNLCRRSRKYVCRLMEPPLLVYFLSQYVLKKFFLNLYQLEIRKPLWQKLPLFASESVLRFADTIYWQTKLKSLNWLLLSWQDKVTPSRSRATRALSCVGCSNHWLGVMHATLRSCCKSFTQILYFWVFLLSKGDN